MSTTIAPKSDQLNSDDLIPGAVTVTISKVTKGSAEQPVNIHLEEYPGRPYRPSKSMRRVMVAAWGGPTEPYVGRKMTLYRNPEIKFGGDVVGGIEISHMSHLDKPLVLAITATRGRKKKHTVQPLVQAPVVTVAEVQACEDVDQLRAWWQTATDDVKAAISKRANQLADLQATSEQDSELVQDALEVVNEE